VEWDGSAVYEQSFTIDGLLRSVSRQTWEGELQCFWC